MTTFGQFADDPYYQTAEEDQANEERDIHRRIDEAIELGDYTEAARLAALLPDAAEHRDEMIRQFNLAKDIVMEATQAAEAVNAANQSPETNADGSFVNAPRIASSTMKGDLLALVIEEVRKLKKPYIDLTEHQQESFIELIEARIAHAVKRAITLIAANGRASVKGKIDSCTIKEQVKVVLLVPISNPDRHAIIDSTGDEVLLVLPDFSAHLGGERPAPDAADQAALPLEGEGAEIAPEDAAAAQLEAMQEEDAHPEGDGQPATALE